MSKKIGMSDFEGTGILCELVKNKWDKSKKGKIKFSYKINNLYEYWVQKTESEGKKPLLDKKNWLLFIRTYLKLVAERTVSEGFIFIMPYHLGRRYMKKSNRRGFVPNKEERRRDQTLNLHSFRKFYSIKWDKELGHFKNRTLWRLDTCTMVDNMVVKEVRNNNKPILDRPLIGFQHKESKWT
jgi:hypothetical protein